MSRGNFDIDSFISEVEERPAIWNMHVPEYSNRVAKQQAWDELVMIFYNLDGPVQKLRALGKYINFCL